MARAVPAWVKAKGFSNWNDYMASIRPLPRRGGTKLYKTPKRTVRQAHRRKNPMRRTDRATKRCSVCGRTEKLVRDKQGKLFCERCLPPEKNPRKRTVRQAHRRKNPIAVYNPAHGKILPMENVEIRYQRTAGNYKSELFRHPFKSSVNVIGLPDGSIQIKSKSGKKLWGTA